MVSPEHFTAAKGVFLIRAKLEHFERNILGVDIDFLICVLCLGHPASCHISPSALSRRSVPLTGSWADFHFLNLNLKHIAQSL